MPLLNVKPATPEAKIEVPAAYAADVSLAGILRTYGIDIDLMAQRLREVEREHADRARTGRLVEEREKADRKRLMQTARLLIEHRRIVIACNGIPVVDGKFTCPRCGAPAPEASALFYGIAEKYLRDYGCDPTRGGFLEQTGYKWPVFGSTVTCQCPACTHAKGKDKRGKPSATSRWLVQLLP